MLVRMAVWVLLLAGCLSFLVQGANNPADPHLTNQYLPGTGPSRIQPVPTTVPTTQGVPTRPPTPTTSSTLSQP